MNHHLIERALTTCVLAGVVVWHHARPYVQDIRKGWAA